MNYTKMPFGKYKGVKFDELEDSYVMYALNEFALPREVVIILARLIFERVHAVLRDNDIKFIEIVRQDEEVENGK